MTELNYDRRGSGPPLVLVHGIGSRWQIWDPLLDELARHRDVISVDLPGFGASPSDPELTPSVPAYARRLARFFEELGIDRPEVAGNSMGGGISIELGRMGHVSRVTAFSPVGFWNGPELRWCQAYFRAVRKVAGRARPIVPALVQNPAGRVAIAGVLIGKPRSLDPAVLFADAMGFVHATSFDEALASFGSYDLKDPEQDWGSLHDIPVTIAWGTRDQLLVQRTQSRRARKAMPWASHVTLRHAGHVPFYDEPEACIRAILDTSVRTTSNGPG